MTNSNLDSGSSITYNKFFVECRSYFLYYNYAVVFAFLVPVLYLLIKTCTSKFKIKINYVCITIFTLCLGGRTVIQYIQYNSCHNQQEEITEKKAFDIIFGAMSSNRLMINSFNRIMTIVAYTFVMRSKELWDIIYFEKISEIYNMEFIFGDN